MIHNLFFLSTSVTKQLLYIYFPLELEWLVYVKRVWGICLLYEWHIPCSLFHCYLTLRLWRLILAAALKLCFDWLFAAYAIYQLKPCNHPHNIRFGKFPSSQMWGKTSLFQHKTFLKNKLFCYFCIDKLVSSTNCILFLSLTGFTILKVILNGILFSEFVNVPIVLYSIMTWLNMFYLICRLNCLEWCIIGHLTFYRSPF